MSNKKEQAVVSVMIKAKFDKKDPTKYYGVGYYNDDLPNRFRVGQSFQYGDPIIDWAEMMLMLGSADEEVEMFVEQSVLDFVELRSDIEWREIEGTRYIVNSKIKTLKQLAEYCQKIKEL